MSDEPEPVRARTTDEEHAAAIAELTEILARDQDPAPESAVGQRLRALAQVIEAYERRRWPI